MHCNQDSANLYSNASIMDVLAGGQGGHGVRGSKFLAKIRALTRLAEQHRRAQGAKRTSVRIYQASRILHHALSLQFHLVTKQRHTAKVKRPTCAGSLARNNRFGNSFTDSTSTNRVLRLSRCTGRLFNTASVDRMDDASMTTSGCSSAKSSASWKK